MKIPFKVWDNEYGARFNAQLGLEVVLLACLSLHLLIKTDLYLILIILFYNIFEMGGAVYMYNKKLINKENG